MLLLQMFDQAVEFRQHLSGFAPKLGIFLLQLFQRHIRSLKSFEAAERPFDSRYGTDHAIV